MTQVTQAISTPCFALFRRNDKWQQVKVLTVIQKAGFDPSNKIEFPDRTTCITPNSNLKFDARIKRFVPHPDAPGPGV